MVDTEYQKKATIVWTSTNAVGDLGATDYEGKGRYMWSAGPMCRNLLESRYHGESWWCLLTVAVRFNEPKIRESKFRRKN